MFDDPTDRYGGVTREFVTFDEPGSIALEALERFANDSETNQPPPPVDGEQPAYVAPEPLSPRERDLFEHIKDLEGRVTQLEKRVFPPAGFDERAYMRDYMKKYRRAKKSKKSDKS